MTYEQADDYAARLCETGTRVVFVTLSVTHAGYDVATYCTALGTPIKRYLRLSTGVVTVKAVTDWRRN